MKIKITPDGKIIRKISKEEIEWHDKEMVELRKRLEKAGLKSFYPRIPEKY